MESGEESGESGEEDEVRDIFILDSEIPELDDDDAEGKARASRVITVNIIEEMVVSSATENTHKFQQMDTTLCTRTITPTSRSGDRDCVQLLGRLQSVCENMQIGDRNGY